MPRAPSKAFNGCDDDDYSKRQYGCLHPGCPRRFARNHDLKRHYRLHEGVMEHACPHCKRKFAQKNGLDVHIATHLGLRTLQCPERDCLVKPFRDESSYRRHWMMFHSLTPPAFLCNRCSHRTGRKSLLAGHMRSQHNNAPLPIEYRPRKERGSSSCLVPSAIRVHVYDHELVDRPARSKPPPRATRAMNLRPNTSNSTSSGYSELSTPSMVRDPDSDAEDSDGVLHSASAAQSFWPEQEGNAKTEGWSVNDFHPGYALPSHALSLSPYYMPEPYYDGNPYQVGHNPWAYPAHVIPSDGTVDVSYPYNEYEDHMMEGPGAYPDLIWEDANTMQMIAEEILIDPTLLAYDGMAQTLEDEVILPISL